MPLMNLLKKCPLPFSFNAYSEDIRIKLIFLSICIWFIIPVTVFFGIQDLFIANFAEGFIELGIVCTLLGLFFFLCRSHNYILAIRFSVIMTSLLMYYETIIGGGNGAAFLWFFIFPVSIIFLLGCSEGFYWISAQVFILAIVLFGEIGYQYKTDLGIRFLVVYIAVSVIVGSLEMLRANYFRQLKKEKTSLQKALNEIKILQGLIPICSSCKNIRDDKGFWMQIESYMKTHADVEFSHGICPQCAEKLFPSHRGKQSETTGEDG